MARKMHKPGLRLALIVGSALIGLVFPYAFLVTLFFLYTVYDDIFGVHIESLPPGPPAPRFHGTAADPEWRQYYELQCESVAEEAFLKAMLDVHDMKPGENALVGNGIRLDMQITVDRYRLDFVANRTYIIEIDGAEWHSSQEAVERDRVRDEYMVSKGYKVLRLPAKVVLNTPKEGLRRVDEYLGRVKPALPVVLPKAPRLTLGELFKQIESQQQLAAQQPAATAVPVVPLHAIVDSKTGMDLNFDDEVEAFLHELDAKKPSSQKSGGI